MNYTFKNGLRIGLIFGFLGYFVIFGNGIITRDEAVINQSLFWSGVAIIGTAVVLLRPLVRGTSINTFLEGLISGGAGFFDIAGVVLALSSGKLPLPS